VSDYQPPGGLGKAARGRGSKTNVIDELPTPAEQHRSMTWAQRLKRVFNIGRSRTSLCFAAFVNPFTSHQDLS